MSDDDKTATMTVALYIFTVASMKRSTVHKPYTRMTIRYCEAQRSPGWTTLKSPPGAPTGGRES